MFAKMYIVFFHMRRAITLFVVGLFTIVSVGCSFPWQYFVAKQTDQAMTLPEPGSEIVLAIKYKTLPEVGSVDLPYIMGDAGNFLLQAGDTITITWENGPTDAAFVVFLYSHKGVNTVIGVDNYLVDGISVQWEVPAHLVGVPLAIAYQADGTPVFRPMFFGDIYSGDLPPTDKCVVSSGTIGAIPIFPVRDDTLRTEPIGDLTPSNQAVVVNRLKEWVEIDLSSIHLVDGSFGIGKTGWIKPSDNVPVRFTGKCD
jgi:hypothetical protein